MDFWTQVPKAVEIFPSSSETKGTLRSYLPVNFSLTLHRIARDANDFDARLREFANERREILSFARASGRIVLGIEIKAQRAWKETAESILLPSLEAMLISGASSPSSIITATPLGVSRGSRCCPRQVVLRKKFIPTFSTARLRNSAAMCRASA